MRLENIEENTHNSCIWLKSQMLIERLTLLANMVAVYVVDKSLQLDSQSLILSHLVPAHVLRGLLNDVPRRYNARAFIVQHIVFSLGKMAIQSRLVCSSNHALHLAPNIVMRMFDWFWTVKL